MSCRDSAKAITRHATAKTEWDDSKWRCLTVLPWRKTAQEAEEDLKAYAEKHGMKVYEGD